MKDEMNVDIELCSTKYCRKLFKCGNQKILELFHRPDFPSFRRILKSQTRILKS